MFESELRLRFLPAAMDAFAERLIHTGGRGGGSSMLPQQKRFPKISAAAASVWVRFGGGGVVCSWCRSGLPRPP